MDARIWRERVLVFTAACAMATAGGCAAEADYDASSGDDAADSELALATGIAGISLPPRQGNSNNGAFSTGPLANTYTQKEVQDTVYHKKGIRIAINPQTVKDATQWANTKNMANWALQKGGFVIFGMWDSNANDTHGDGHGDGRVDDLASAKSMWSAVAAVYRGNSRVFFELFNEPFGYTRPGDYIAAMKAIMPDDVPHGRIILDGLGYAQNVQAIKGLWDGLLGYHAYLFWLGAGKRTQSNYSNLVQGALAGVAQRTFVTEFGADLKRPGDYDDSSNPDENIQFMKGIDDAFHALRPKGTFYWHGFNNGDSYSYWSGTTSAKAKVDRAQTY